MNITIRQEDMGWVLEGHPAGLKRFNHWFDAWESMRGTIDERFKAVITVYPMGTK